MKCVSACCCRSVMFDGHLATEMESGACAMPVEEQLWLAVAGKRYLGLVQLWDMLTYWDGL